MRKEAENKTMDRMRAKIPIENASIMVFFRFSSAPTPELSNITAKSVTRKEIFAMVAEMSITVLMAWGIPKGRMDARVQAPLTNNIRSDMRTNQTGGLCSITSLPHFCE